MHISDYTMPVGKRSLRYDEETPGLVVKDFNDTKKDNVIGVYIPRLMFGLPIGSGSYEKSVTVDTKKIVNTINKTVGSSSLKVRNYVELPIAIIPNIIPPKFVKGENVFVDMADSDLKSLYIKPYTMGETKRRKTDMWSIVCPNLKSENDDITEDNSYGFQIDTINQIIGLWTTKVNGEKSAYSFAINPKDGKVVLSDDGKRVITIDTAADSIEQVNEAGSKIKIEKGVMDLEADTINIKAKEDINMESKNLNRTIDNIKTSATEDVEEIDKLTLKGNEYSLDYNKQELSGSSYRNKTSKWVVDSPISGFTKVLTADSFSISPNAGINPMPTCANISNAGIAAFGNPSTPSLPLAKQQPTFACLTAIAAVVDSLAAILGIPPTLSTTVSSMSTPMISNNVKG